MIAAATISLLLALLLSGFSQAGKSYTADRFDVRIDVQRDGSLIVSETVAFRFVGGPFTYAFRDLAFLELDEIDRLQAGMDEEA
jgi:MoxR-like ATPase